MRDEFFSSFAAQVRGKADICAFSADCSCGMEVNHIDRMIGDTLQNGISDLDILEGGVGNCRCSHYGGQLNAIPASDVSAVSAFRRQKLTTVSKICRSF